MRKKQVTAAEDQLLVMHRKARKRKKRKLLITVSVVCIVVILTIAIGVTMLQRKVRSQLSSSQNSVKSTQVSVGNISTTVSGSGTLSADDVETMEIPDTIEVAEYYVEAGDKVSEGDLIATVTNSSLLTAMSAKQAELDALDEELEEASAEEVDDVITSKIAGRVKKIYAVEDGDVATTMYESGALLLLSLDGYMAVNIESETLAAGDSVSVVLSDENIVDGLVEKVLNNTATILVTDDGTLYEDSVKVQDADGNELGSGTLYIHSEFMIVGYAGTIEAIEVSENEEISAGDTLIELTDTETTVNYDALLKKRANLESDLERLIKIYKEGGIFAPFAGVVESLESSSSSSAGSSYSSFNMSAQSGMGSGTSNGISGSVSNSAAGGSSSSGTTALASISPDTTMAITISVDETDILSLSVGQEALVSIDSISTEETFEAVVAEVNTTASSDSGVTSYSAVIHLDKTEQMLSGMSASVVITIEGHEDALLIPVDALHQTSSTAYVYTTYDEETGAFGGMKEVTVGLSNSSYVEITEGLEEDDVVYYTESEEDSMFNNMMNFGGMGGQGGMGNMPSFGGGMGEMPSGGFGGGMPNGGFGGSSGSQGGGFGRR